MIIKNLKLINFRNHVKLTNTFEESENMIVGPNGTGKTNILEAIYLLSTGKSFRAKYDYEMIHNPQISSEIGGIEVFNGEVDPTMFAKVSGVFTDGRDEDTIEVIVTKEASGNSKKIYKINGTPKRIYDSKGLFLTVLFTPQDLELFTGSPSHRRRMTDDILSKIDDKYKKELNIYSKALRQRNKILEKLNKTGQGYSELDIWTEKLLESGVYLQGKRTELFDLLTPMTKQIYRDISSHKVETSIEYNINVISRERLAHHREHEIFAKTTLVGPHRDDFEFLVNGFGISSYGSRGQQRTAVLALKISELGLTKNKHKSSPVLLLDDIFSELDEVHVSALKDTVKRQQTIITSTHPVDYLHPAGNMQILK